jgi:hypothetical protein
MRRSLSVMTLLAGCAVGARLWWAQHRLSGLSRATAAPELLISLPRFAQVLMAGGDRYLAANLAGFRVLVADTGRMNAEDYAVQAGCSAILPGSTRCTKTITTLARRFCRGMANWMRHNTSCAGLRRRGPSIGTRCSITVSSSIIFARTRRQARSGCSRASRGSPISRTSGRCRMSLPAWIEKGYQTANAATMVDAMAADSPPGAFRNYLQVRARRLRDLAALQDAATLFQARHGRGVKKLEELVSAGLIAELPKDPLGFGFGLDAAGWPILNSVAAGGQ